ncbi:MAG TPA: hypothetical protein VIN77_03950 [Aurantimonas sp.]|uniref:Uncharacterized protein n=1 Tax=Aurantimonas marianensis TaxID=2920428 RepID=A0A9X2HFJ8_9HYPH|nr:hypothetical protein [Aurantimonas marianensis]MCP3056674.1 hypothetical protein [Aurantimonas marianensis]
MSDSLARKLIANRPVVGQLTLAGAPSAAATAVSSSGGMINRVKARSSRTDERRSA